MAETLLPYQTCPYSWDEPLGERAVIVERMAGVPAGATPLGRRSGRTNAIAADADDAAAEGVGSGTPRRASVRSGGGDGSGEDVSGVFIGVYGLDLMRPSTVVGNIRIGGALWGRVCYQGGGGIGERGTQGCNTVAQGCCCSPLLLARMPAICGDCVCARPLPRCASLYCLR